MVALVCGALEGAVRGGEEAEVGKGVGMEARRKGAGPPEWRPMGQEGGVACGRWEGERRNGRGRNDARRGGARRETKVGGVWRAMNEAWGVPAVSPSGPQCVPIVPKRTSRGHLGLVGNTGGHRDPVGDTKGDIKDLVVAPRAGRRARGGDVTFSCFLPAAPRFPGTVTGASSSPGLSSECPQRPWIPAKCDNPGVVGREGTGSRKGDRRAWEEEGK